MPKLELGDLESVERLKEANIAELDRLASQGYTIVSPIPSCTLMFKQELPLLFAQDERVIRVAAAMKDPFEFMAGLKKRGEFKTDFSRHLGKVSYHIPCHARVQNVGQKTREMLEAIPGTTVTAVERCSGHAGTWGVKSEYHATAMKIGTPVFRQMNAAEPDVISSDCQLAAHHIEQGIRQLPGQDGRRAPEVAHPLTLMRRAYGIKDV
jgi:Fe-S oxidoreductase